MKWINQYAAMLHLFVTVQYLHSHEQKSMKIACGNGIFACHPMFSYGQRSKCADLLNSYDYFTFRYRFTYLPVYDTVLSATSSGVPFAITVPPRSPPSGPISMR